MSIAEYPRPKMKSPAIIPGTVIVRPIVMTPAGMTNCEILRVFFDPSRWTSLPEYWAPNTAPTLLAASIRPNCASFSPKSLLISGIRGTQAIELMPMTKNNTASDQRARTARVVICMGPLLAQSYVHNLGNQLVLSTLN